MAARALAVLLLLLCAGTAGAAPFQRGVSLGLFSEDPLWSYKGLLKEIAALGASHVELVVAYYQRDAASTDIYYHPRFTAPDDTVRTAIREAHALGLKVMLFPIVRLEAPRTDKEWRGTLAPADGAAWWRSYGERLDNLARMAAREGVEVLSVGSELSTLDRDHGPWQALIARVRQVFHGQLTYSGNWDHYQDVGIYDLVDLVGVCGYFSLVDRLSRPPYAVDQLMAGWRELREKLERFVKEKGKPLLFTELGYLSQTGASAWPWDEGATKPADLEEQRRCYEAFVRTWTAAPALGGVYFWNWYGWGGSTSGGYTPRGKPATDEIRAFFGGRC